MTDCEASCKTCNGQTSSDCLTCTNTDHVAPAGGGTCAACHTDCVTGKCTLGDDASKCTECKSGTYPITNTAYFSCDGEILYIYSINILKNLSN